MLQKNLNILIEKEIKTILENFRGFNLANFSQITNPAKIFKYLSNRLPYIGQGSSRIVFGIGSGKVIKVAGNYNQISFLEKTYISGNMSKEKYLASKEKVTKNISNSITLGKAQNEAEVSIYTDPTLQPIYAKILNYDNQGFFWLVSEAVREVSYKELEKYFGVPMYIFEYFIRPGNKGPYNEKQLISWIEDVFGTDPTDIWYQMTSKITGKKFISLAEVVEYLVKVYNSPVVKAVMSAVNNGKLIPSDIELNKHWGKTVDGKVVLLDYGFTREVEKLY